ncbi:MAG: hypothetical protein M3N95_15855 [Actinomycetota bacterium]|nr:hypothetical protein [Actinomycetota bacterium]
MSQQEAEDAHTSRPLADGGVIGILVGMLAAVSGGGLLALGSRPAVGSNKH